jgi:tetratricopeptide (TPR) repeat protein
MITMQSRFQPRPRARLAALLSILSLCAAGCTSLGAPASRPQPPPASPPRSQPPPPATAPPPVASPAPAPAPAPGLPAPAPQPSRPQSDARSASASLLAESRTARAAGRYPQAAASIERALRIDPNNAELWLELGEIQLAQGNAPQAASMARKALTLTGGDRDLESRAERLLRRAGAG